MLWEHRGKDQLILPGGVCDSLTIILEPVSIFFFTFTFLFSKYPLLFHLLPFLSGNLGRCTLSQGHQENLETHSELGVRIPWPGV